MIRQHGGKQAGERAVGGSIAFLFVAFMMGSVLWNYTSFPTYLPIQLVLLPFLIVYFFLFMVLISALPQARRQDFPRCSKSHP